jgi:nitroreductase
MTYDDVVLGRRSIRGYKPDPVPKSVIKEVIALALRAPSSLNTQPWNFHVIAGEPLDRIRAGNTERNLAGVPHSREFRTQGEYGGAHRERQIGVAKQLFDAPVSIVVTYDRSIHGSDIGPFDCGAVVNALVNAAWSRGLGCVINSQGIMQSPVVREHGAIPDDEVIMICVAMGYPDDSFPANAVVSERKSVDEAVVFVGFDD